MELSKLYGIFLIDFGRGNRIEMHIVGSYFLLNMEGGEGERKFLAIALKKDVNFRSSDHISM